MKSIFRSVSFLIFMVFLLALSVEIALAKGPPDRVTIEGPRLDTPIEISDVNVLMAFSFFQFEDVNKQIEEPSGPAEGYLITRYIEEAGEMIPWDRLVYYPEWSGDGGIVFVEGLIGPNSTEFDGSWYRASTAGDAAMRQILSLAVTEPVRADSLKAQVAGQASPGARGSVSPAGGESPEARLAELFDLRFMTPIALGLIALGLAVVFRYTRHRANSPL
jgi:hypothetical protein